ncbi:hypothetical protein LTS18_015081, partial [Coniosporium uncinatum]
SVKEQLEAKLQELGNLVAGMGQLPKPAVKVKRRSGSRLSGGWGARLATDPEAEGRLPTITEDKSYPRKTLDAQEIRALADANTDSPDLGPPPVAHFQDEDPIKYDPQLKPQEEEPRDGLGSEALPANLSVNLETRRRRKDDQVRKELRKLSVFQSPPERTDVASSTDTITTLPIRTGAKRKLSAREDEMRPDIAFTEFSRRTPTDMERPDTQQDQMSTDPPVEARDSKPQSVPGSTQIDRKILGEKNVNTDPIVSPKKLTKSAPLDGKTDKLDFKKPLLPFKDSTRNRIRDRKSRTVAAEPPSLNVPPPDQAPEIVQTIELPLEPEMSALPPKTPAGLDLFSPTSTDASTSCPPTEGRDTPPPSGL